MINIFCTPALNAALEYAGLTRVEVSCSLIRRQGSLYELEFQTDWLKYDCYVDAESYQVLGFSFEPIPDREQGKNGNICSGDEPVINI